MKSRTKSQLKPNNGITLIALVITIIVLIILAGVSIAMLVGENGIITQAQRAAQETEQAQVEEQRQLAMLEAAMNTENQPYTDKNGDTATIPAGFAVSQVEGENTIEDGLVIIDANGNEFVWIPINDISMMAMNTEGKDKNGNDNYQGKLYIFNELGSNEMENYGQITQSYREPAVLNGYDDIIAPTLDENWTELTYQEQYNEMIESVIKNKGFYIGRFETNFNSNTVESKRNTIVANVNNINWYQMYQKSRQFASNSVQSSMVWGSQWDAMLNFALSGKDSEKVNASSNAPHDLTTAYKSGEQESDKINNIYDLEGNIREWTVETDESSYRVVRGGMYDSASAPSFRLSRYNPGTSYYYNGSRLSLYIK